MIRGEERLGLDIEKDRVSARVWFDVVIIVINIIESLLSLTSNLVL